MFGLLALLYVLSLLPVVQKFTIQFVTKQVSNVIGLNVSASAIRLSVHNAISLHDVNVTNATNDTILRAEKVGAQLTVIDFNSLQITLNAIKLKNATVRAVKESNGLWNFDNLLTKLFSDTTSKGWTVAIETIEVQNSTLILENKTKEKSQDFGIDFNNLAIENFSCKINALQMLKEGGVEFAINTLQGREQSGFEIKKLQSQVHLDATKIDLQNLELQTNKSDISLPTLQFSYNSFGSFSNFLTEVAIASDIKKSTVAFSDIAYFASSLEFVPYIFSVEGNVQGTVADFKARNLTIATSNATRFVGNVECSGLPKIRETYLYVQAKTLETSYSDISQFRIPPFTSQKFVNVPTIVRKLSYINYKGNFSGFVGDFVAYGTWNTNLGDFKTDISLARKEERNVEYSGKIQTSSFDIGSLLSAQKILNKVSMSVSTKGNVYNAKEITGNVTGEIQSIECNQYKYSNIELTGNYTNTKYDGQVSINDPNLLMDFSGLLDFTDTVPVFLFESTVEHAHLFPLNFHPSDTSAQVSLQLAVNSVGIEIDNLNGEIDIQNFKYSGDIGEYATNNMHLQLANNQHNRKVDVKSDLFDLSLQGTGHYSEVPAYLYSFLRKHIPSLPERFKNTKRTVSPQFTANITTKELNNFLQVAIPQLSIAPQSTVKLLLDESNQQFNLHSNIAFASYNDLQFQNVDITIDRDNNNIETAIDFGFNSFANIQLRNKIEHDSAFSKIAWNTTNAIRTKGELFIDAYLGKSLQSFPDALEFYVQGGQVSVVDSLWSIEKSKLTINAGDVAIQNFMLQNNFQRIAVNGEVSKDPQKRLTVQLENFSASNISHILAKQNMQFEGILGGTIELRDLFNKQRMYINIQSPELKFNEHLLGELKMRSRLLPNHNALALDFSLAQDSAAGLNAKGVYNFNTDAAEFNLALNNIDLQVFQIFLNGVLNNIQGKVDGNVRMAGKLAKPQFDGNLKIQNAAFTVDYTQVPYVLNSEVNIHETQCSFVNAKLTDTLNNSADLSGYIDLKTPANPRYVINIQTLKLLVVNIAENQNEIFYGTVIYKGWVNIDGNLSGIKIDGEGETLGVSEVNLPLTSSELSQQDFLHFVSTASNNTNNSELPKSSFKPEMNLNVKVTPQTIVRIIFDKRLGDIIRVQGNSDLKLKLSEQGDFTVFGEYVVSEGTYLFTLRNLVNKLFSIQSNGRIFFNGNPLNAQVDLNARYELKASPQPVMTETDKKYRRTPVICEINLAEKLLSPNIGYKILVPSSSEVQNVLDLMTDEEKNLQFLSLLLMNSFVAQENESQGVNANTSFEVLSNQLNNIIAQMNLPIDVGVNFRKGDVYDDSNELELELSRSLFNNRLVINVNGYSGLGGAETEATVENKDQLAGDVSMEVVLNDTGTLRMKGFSRSNNDPLKENSENTQGVSLFYTKEFNTWREFFTRRKAAKKKKE